MTRNEIELALAGRIENGDAECITSCVQLVTWAGWQVFGYSADAESKAEYQGFGWKGWDIKIMGNFAKRTRRRDLSVKELNYAIKVLPKYVPQVAELLAKGIYAEVQTAFEPFKS